MNLLHSKRTKVERPFWPYFTAFDAALGQPGCLVCNHLERCERKTSLGHTQSAIESWRDDAKRARVAALARNYMQQMRGDLAECIRKYDHRFREETSERDREAVPRSVRFLKGGTYLR